jgi:uncharacterized protein (DUF58 family)
MSPSPEHAAPQTLDRRRVYIFPSRAGGMFAVVLATMLLGSINYGSSLGYLLTFLLGSLALVAMLHTWRNLIGLRCGGGKAAPVFAGHEAIFDLYLDNRGSRQRHALAISTAPGRRLWPRAPAMHPATVRADADQISVLQIRKAAERRGRLPLGRIEIATTFPVGLFRAWSYWSPPVQCLVYPRPAGALPLPSLADEAAIADSGTRQGTDDFFGFRDYRPGDSPRHIAWKALAREQGLHVKRFTGGGRGELMLRLADPNLAGPLETRLSQLCKWVLTADRMGLAYGLEMPGMRLPIDTGETHRERCLATLATFDPATAP